MHKSSRSMPFLTDGTKLGCDKFFAWYLRIPLRAGIRRGQRTREGSRGGRRQRTEDEEDLEGVGEGMEGRCRQRAEDGGLGTDVDGSGEGKDGVVSQLAKPENENVEPLNWERRVRIAQDVSRGIEYLHDGAVPSVLHRDIKSANILLDHSMRARVADFGLSKEENLDVHMSDIRGTYGYLDPEYISTKNFTKKSDVYSFGILLFELITGRNPQQGLIEYIELAAISAEGKSGWEEIIDSRLIGNCSMEEAGAMAAIAYKCVHKSARKRPTMRDVSQAVSEIGRKKRADKHGKRFSITVDESSEVEQIEPSKIEFDNEGVTIDENSEAEQIDFPKDELNDETNV